MKETLPNAAARKSWSGIWIPVLLLLLWSGVQLARNPGFFWCDDYQGYYSPICDEIVRSWHDGEWPLLSQNSWCAGNLAGEFQNGTFSPPRNLLLVGIWALPLTLAGKAAALSMAYLAWLAMGTFMVGRLRGLTVPLATMAALATSLSGWVITWGATDWITFLAGFSWVPWVWWTLQTAMDSNSVWKRWLRPGLFVALLVTEGNAFAAIEVAMITIWLGTQAITTPRNWRALGPLAVAGLLGTGLSAPAWWLLIEMLHSSPRGEWGNVLNITWTVPWNGWSGLILPSFVCRWRDFGVSPDPHANLELACGLAPVAALAAALLFQPWATIRKLRWELVFLAFCALLVCLPSIGQFRWSFRWLPLFHLLLALTAASAWQQGLVRRVATVAAGLVAVTWLYATCFAENRSPLLAGLLLALTIAWWLGERFSPPKFGDWLPVAVVALALTFTYAILPTDQSVPKYSFGENIRHPAPLDPSRLYLGLYSLDEIQNARSRPPGYGTIVRPLNSMSYANLRFLNGYCAFGGREVAGLFETHGDVHPAKAESLAGPDGERLLLFLGVDGIVFSRDYLPFTRTLGPEWKQVAEAPEGVVYHRDPARFTPVKVLSTVFDRPGVPLAKPALQIIAERRNSVTVRVTPADAPATPVHADIGATDVAPAIAPIAFVRPFLNGYQALFNGRSVPVRAYRNILPIVELPANASGILELRYRPRGLTGGLLVTALTVAVMLLTAVVGVRAPTPQKAAVATVERIAPLSRRTLASIYAVYLLFLAALLVASLEVVLRFKGVKPWRKENLILQVEPGGKFFAKSSTLGYTHIPGKFKVTQPSGNSFTVTHLPNTLRATHPVEIDQTPGAKEEIWIFGCSFTHGWSLNDEETYPWLLQERFPGQEVVNFGVSGYGEVQSLLQFREALQRKTPKIAILAYSSIHDDRNTFSRNYRKATIPWDNLGPRIQPYARLDSKGGLQLLTVDARYPEFPLMRRLALAHFLEMKYDEVESQWNSGSIVSEKLVLEMAKTAKEHQVTFILANIHDGQVVQDFARKNGIPSIDISVDLRVPENTNLPYDAHPSAIANRHYAQKLGDFVAPFITEKK